MIISQAFDGIAQTLLTTQGDIIRRSATAAERVALGTVSYPLLSDGTDAVWGQLVNAGVDNAAAIAYSKLNLAAGVTLADIAAGYSLPTIIRKTSDETVNNSTALQNDDELTFAIGANEVWDVTLTLLFNTPANADIKIGFAHPVGCVFFGASARRDANNAVQVGSVGEASVIDYNGTATPTCQGMIRFVVVNGANAGNFVIQWAQYVAQVADTKVLTNSYLVLNRIA